jgi:hypothetical protein
VRELLWEARDHRRDLRPTYTTDAATEPLFGATEALPEPLELSGGAHKAVPERELDAVLRREPSPRTLERALVDVNAKGGR